MWQTITEAIALFLFVAFLFARRWERVEQFYRETKVPTGSPIDVTPIAHRLKNIRQDYTAKLESNPSRTCHRVLMLKTIRLALRRLAFFQHPKV